MVSTASQASASFAPPIATSALICSPVLFARQAILFMEVSVRNVLGRVATSVQVGFSPSSMNRARKWVIVKPARRIIIVRNVGQLLISVQLAMKAMSSLGLHAYGKLG